MVGAMLVPLPTGLLDLLLTANLSLAILVLLVALYATRGLELSAFPTLLLVTTLYRLVLNVSTTRLILLQADAGDVVRSFGDFVVQGNYIVGGVVFAIITLVQFVVIARGSERVAEVGARFALDAMPGKQMSIDGEQRSGAITREEATTRRKALQRESELYGAMDGGMKFVKGDAIAGLVIIAVNLLGGFAIGVGTRGLDFDEALRIYGLLTIGDGLVSQIPALLISTAAGVVVTRVSSEDEGGSLAADLAEQLIGRPRALFLGSMFLGVLALVPGLPTIPFLSIALLLASVAYWMTRTHRGTLLREAVGGDGTDGSDGAVLVLEVDSTILDIVSRPLLEQHVPRLRERVLTDKGLLLPPVGLRARTTEGFAITLHGVTVAHGSVPGTKEESAALPEGATNLDPADYIARKLSEVVDQRADQLVDMQTVQGLLDRLASHRPTVVQETVPRRVDLATLTGVVRRLASEGVRLRPLDRVLEAIAGARTTDPQRLTEAARRSLRRGLTADLTEDGVLPVHTLDPLIEEAIGDAVRTAEGEPYLALSPDLTNDILRSVRERDPKVLVVPPTIRPFVRELLAIPMPKTAVLSYQEVDPEVEVLEMGRIEP